MHSKTILLIFFISTLFLKPLNAQHLNTLTPEETEEGWQLLFNGKDLTGWHSYLQNKPGKAWKIEDQSIILDRNSETPYPEYADLVTDSEFENFELSLEWKITPCGNSGVMFYVHESPDYKNTYETGPEMQIVDLYCSPDTRVLRHRAGDIYDLVPVDTVWVTEGGKWNEYRIKCEQGHLQLFQNGHKVIDTYLWNDEWKELIAKSKFADMPYFGTFHKGHISLQGTENGKLLFRNIKIRQI